MGKHYYVSSSIDGHNVHRADGEVLASKLERLAAIELCERLEVYRELMARQIKRIGMAIRSDLWESFSSVVKRGEELKTVYDELLATYNKLVDKEMP